MLAAMLGRTPAHEVVGIENVSEKVSFPPSAPRRKFAPTSTKNPCFNDRIQEVSFQPYRSVDGGKTGRAFRHSLFHAQHVYHNSTLIIVTRTDEVCTALPVPYSGKPAHVPDSASTS